MELVYKEKIRSEREMIENQRKQLEKLRERVCTERIEILNLSKTTSKESSSRHVQRSTEKLLNEIEANGSLFDLNVQRVESELIEYYSKLLKYRRQIDKLLINNPYGVTSADYQLLSESQEKLLDEITEVLVIFGLHHVCTCVCILE